MEALYETVSVPRVVLGVKKTWRCALESIVRRVPEAVQNAAAIGDTAALVYVGGYDPGDVEHLMKYGVLADALRPFTVRRVHYVYLEVSWKLIA